MYTFKRLREQYSSLMCAGYNIMTCMDYIDAKRRGNASGQKIVINRVDVDSSLSKCARLARMFDLLDIKASFFIRTQADEYNPLSFEAYNIIREIIDGGHEVGYHSEIVDCAAIWGSDPSVALIKNVSVLEVMYDIKINGVASHGGLTGNNNLSFWENRDAKEYGLEYEAYDKRNLGAFDNSLYVSDSEFTRWKCYRNGILASGDLRSPAEHIPDKPELIYMLIHPENYYERHAYEW